MRGNYVVLVLLAGFAACTAGKARAAPPDWFGIWEVEGVQIGASGTAETPWDEIQKNFGAPPSLTPEAKGKFESLLKMAPPLRKICEFGFPMVMLDSPLVFEVLTTPRETAMIFSAREMRHIYTDGRALPAPDERIPTHWGSSVGHWEGKTLVVETVATDRGGVWIWSGNHSELLALLGEQTRYTERIRMIARDTLEDQLTINDPAQFSHPWVMTHRYRRARGITTMIHEECEGNDRNPLVNGEFTIR